MLRWNFKQLQKFIGECFRTEDILWCNFLSWIQTMLGQSFKQFICFTDIGECFRTEDILWCNFLSLIQTMLGQSFKQFISFTDKNNAFSFTNRNSA